MGSSETEIAAEVEATCRRYIEDFPAAIWRHLQNGTPIDYDAIDFWLFPVLFIMGDGKGGSSVWMTDQASLNSGICALYEQYRAQGWAGDLRIDSAKVTVVSPNVALIETTGTRFLRDGSDFNTWDSCYWMKRTAAGWKQSAVIDAQPPRPQVPEWIRWLRAVGGL